MAKDAYYFSHDYNSRADCKIKALIRKHGMEGYGIFWSIVEDLYQNSNSIPYDIDGISFDYRVQDSIIESILNDFDLFIIIDNIISSESVGRRLDIRDSKSESGRASASKRWGVDEDGSRLKAKECLFYIIEVFNNEEKFIKCGITKDSVSRRYSGKLNGYDYKTIFTYDDDVFKCLELENNIRSSFDKYNPIIKFAGYEECYKYSDTENVKYFAMQHFNIPIAKIKIRNAIKESKGNKLKDIKEKENTESKLSKSVLFENPSSDFEKLHNWINTKLPSVANLKTQLTEQEFNVLASKYPKSKITDTLEAMENKADLNKKYKSVYLTLNTWLKR